MIDFQFHNNTTKYLKENGRYECKVSVHFLEIAGISSW
jgi:hypothetical protein